MLQNAGVLYILSCKCASRHSGVWFFNIWSAKSGPYPSVFSHFDLQMCLAPQPRTIFEHLNFKKWPESVVFCTFWLTNVLRATAACDFWTSERPKLVRDCGVSSILTCKCASRHSGVPFFRIASSKMARGSTTDDSFQNTTTEFKIRQLNSPHPNSYSDCYF